MCLLFAACRVLPDCPLLLFMNRDESPSRATRAPALCADPGRTPWFGGIDLEAGGTWLGVNQQGLVVAVTNRAKTAVGGPLRSRGLLCRDLLGCRSIDEAIAEVEAQTDRSSFAGFNVLLFESGAGAIVEAGDRVRSTRIPPGVHAITNEQLDDAADPRIARLLQECPAIVGPAPRLADRIREAKRVSGLADDGDRPALCVHRGERETVSSTIIALTADPSRGHYLYAPGPPCRTPFDDNSAPFREMMTSGLH